MQLLVLSLKKARRQFYLGGGNTDLAAFLLGAPRAATGVTERGEFVGLISTTVSRKERDNEENAFEFAGSNSDLRNDDVVAGACPAPVRPSQ